MLRLQHRLTPTLSLLCSSPTSKACYAQAPTDILPPYIKPVMPRLLHHHPSPIYIKPIHQAYHAQVPTYAPHMHQACYARAPTSSP